jgi:hypothetical protein
MANAARKPIPRKTQAAVMIQSRGRCALCFHWYDDLSVKAGQLAHIDRNRANHAETNIAFLCQPHHDQYDTTPSQTKRVMPEVLAAAKQELQRAIANGRHLTALSVAAVAAHETDRAAFAELLRMMTESRTADFLRRTCFGSESFHWRQLNEIENYVTFSDGAECEFIDRDLEALRQKFIAQYKIFRPLLSRNTAPTRHNPPYRTVPIEWEDTDPKRYARTVRLLRAAADKVCTAYDELVRMGGRGWHHDDRSHHCARARFDSVHADAEGGEARAGVFLPRR